PTATPPLSLHDALPISQADLDDLDPDLLRVRIGACSRGRHDLVTLGGDRLVDRALVDFLGQAEAYRLRQALLGELFVTSDGLVVLANVDDAPIGDEVDVERRLFRGRDAVGPRRVEGQDPPVVDLDVLQQG